MYVNVKLMPVETIPGIGGEVNSNMTYLIHCKKLCKCHNVLLPNTTIKEKINKTKKKVPHFGLLMKS
jgi:hypothetical protein